MTNYMLKKTLITKYEKEYKAGNFEKAYIIGEKLQKYNIFTVHAVDYIYFVNCLDDKLIYRLEL